MKTFALVLLLAGCNGVAIVDDVDLTLDFTPLIGPSDALHTPYVEGAAMTLWMSAQAGNDTMSSWTIDSSDPSVFVIDSQEHVNDHDTHTFSARSHAVHAGTTTINIRDGGGHLLHSRSVRVGHPDRIELLPHGPLLVGRADVPAVFGDGKILAGGTSTYLTYYWLGAERLNGNGALTIANPTNASVDVQQSFLFEDRDWLQVSPVLAGSPWSVSLMVGGSEVSKITGVTAATADVAQLKIVGEDESRAHKGDWLVALGQGLDAAGQVIYGVEFKWSVNGASELGVGDLYRYTYNSALPKMLTAQFGSTSAAAMIHSSGGFVDSTNHIGCSMSGARKSSPWGTACLAITFGLFGFLARRRGRAIMAR